MPAKVQRRAIDRSQRLRRGVQFGFAALNVGIAAEFYLWVRQYETGGPWTIFVRQAWKAGCRLRVCSI